MKNKHLKLKKIKKLDKIFSFKFNHQKIGSLKSFYPKKGGIGEFKNFFINVRSKDIFLKTKIKKIKINNKKIYEIITNGKKFNPDYVISTIDQTLLSKLYVTNKFNLRKLNQSKNIDEKNFYWNFINIVSNNNFFSYILYLF